jgi:4-diphosphocytidyl-2-C-methyl-D-erythritol kinase
MRHKTITLNAPAKINLTLDVCGKLPNGYHEIDSTFQLVDIYDKIYIKVMDELTEPVITSNIDLPKENTVYKAAYGIPCRIHIEKHIPVMAGLGGGSSDAAAVLRHFGREHMADSIGDDVKYFLMSHEIVEPSFYVIVQGNERNSTKEMYDKLDKIDIAHTKELYTNVFEQALPANSEIFAIKADLMKFGAIAAAMSGSGSAVYGVFGDFNAAKKCEKQLKTKYAFVEACHGI